MKLLRLDLTAYGVFTNRSIVLDPSKSFHLIYGLNEAGKSTALHAVHDLFFGIPGQTSYNFRHDYKQLRIGGCINALQELPGHYRKSEVVKQYLSTSTN